MCRNRKGAGRWVAATCYGASRVIVSRYDEPSIGATEARAALVRSIKVAKGEVWIGTQDKVLRMAQLEGEIDVAQCDRRVLGGVTGATLDAVVTVSDVGDSHEVRAPTQLGSYGALQLSLDALGEAVRRGK